MKRLHPAAAAIVFGLPADGSTATPGALALPPFTPTPRAEVVLPTPTTAQREHIEAAHAAAFASAVGAALRAGVRLLEAEGLRGHWRGVLAARYPKGIERGEPLAHFLPTLPSGLHSRLTICGRIKRTALADIASGVPCPACVERLAMRLALRGAVESTKGVR